MNKFLQKNKRMVVIILIAVLIIGVAYYLTLGKKPKQDPATGFTSGSGSSTGGSTPTGTSAGTTSNTSTGSFPIRWGVKNAYCALLQQRLNQSIKCYSGTPLTTDGILGSNTLSAIKRSFPNVGSSVEANRAVSKEQYDIMINSKPNCA